MKKVHITTCPVCGGCETGDYLHCMDHYASGEPYQIGRCKQCGFLFTQDFPDESEIGRYYETPDYISHSDTRKGIMNRVYHLVRQFMLRRKADLTESLIAGGNDREKQQPKKAILDIGCGTGYFLEAMKQRGWKTQGVEKSEAAAAAARRGFGLDIEPDLSNIAADARFDVISLWHVMEHLQDLPGVFVRLREMLTNQGRLIIAVPNSVSYDAAYYGKYWGAYDVPRHLWHFSPDTFARLVNKEGFEIEKFAPMPFDAFYVSMLSEKYKGNKNSFIRGMMRGAIALTYALRDPRKSSSIIYILRRKQ
ncbi:MAG: class I SAM-dependent methyltransferase [Bacteroidales bacterium]